MLKLKKGSRASDGMEEIHKFARVGDSTTPDGRNMKHYAVDSMRLSILSQESSTFASHIARPR